MAVDISVIIPTFRRSEYLEEAINSVLKQDYSSFEIIVVDDNGDLPECRKATKELENKYTKEYNNIKFIYPEKNLGVGLARNYGVNISNGEYITFLDDDDYFLENKLSLCVEYLKKYNADVAYNFAIDSNGIVYEENFGGNYMYYLFKYGSIFSIAGLSLRKDKFFECGGFKDIIAKEEANLNYDLLKINPKIVCVPYVLYCCRDHNNIRISTSKNMIYGELSIYNIYLTEKNNFSKQEQYDIEINIYERLIKRSVEAREIKYLVKFIKLLIFKYKIKGIFVLIKNFYKMLRKIVKKIKH